MTEVIDSLDFVNTILFQKHVFFPTHFALLPQAYSLIAGFCSQIVPERENARQNGI